MKNSRTLALLVAAILVASASFGASKPITLKIELPAKPAFPRPDMAAVLTAGPLALEVTDARRVDDPAVVGAMHEKGEDVYLWRTAEPVAPAVKELAAQVLGGWSVGVAPEAETGLKLSLKTYYVTEKSEMFGSTYVADVSFKVALVNRAGAVLWAGEAAGSAKRPGVDARASMCNEALSFALRGALAKALSSVSLEPPAPAPAPVPAAQAPVTIEPDALLADLTRLKAGGVTDDVLVGYVEQRKLSRPLNVDEILRWKNAGIPDAAIKAATRP